jgi:hypothetical protein
VAKKDVKPFENHEREQTLELLYKNLRGLEEDKAKIKKRKETIEQLMAELAMGGRADVNQGSLPLGEDDDDHDDAKEPADPPRWPRRRPRRGRRRTARPTPRPPSTA